MGENSRSPRRLSTEAARRIAVAASGLSVPRPARVGPARLRGVFARLGLVQIDSVARVVRAHYMLFFSRLGPYDRSTLDRLFHGPARATRVTGEGTACHRAPGPGERGERMGVEYWVHEAAYAPPQVIAALDGRRARFRDRYYRAELERETPAEARAHRHLYADVLRVLGEGPATARELDARIDHDIPEAERDHWGWNPSRVKAAAEALLRTGHVSVAARNGHFERVYALPGDVHPDLPAPAAWPEIDGSAGPDAEATDDVEFLVLEATRALGIGRIDCLADYHRQRTTPVKEAVATLVADGRLEEVDVEGVRAWMLPGTPVPRTDRGTALLAPFDPLVFNRKRIAWLFGFDYRIEIYTPAHLRVHGYYVLPFLHAGRLVGRVDLAADRKAGLLHAHAVHWEDGRGTPDDHAALESELHTLATWLGLRLS
ncbi:winged helix-turn-helix domain-containing protein [Brevibacterium litoralis]|uniref:winged helix-turn-helix domain-containing protein n=1 Tax=Brevibacterium litoralis TaxID=3138935 RepID=UPI0032EE0284